MLDNLNTPKFVEKFQEMISETLFEMNKNDNLNAKNLAAIELWENEFLKLDLLPDISEEVLNLAQKRMEAKQKKDWENSDKIRDDLKQEGFFIDDYLWGWAIWKD